MRDEIDADGVRRWCRAAADALGQVRDEIDALNVFPVPDGDTGTNLHLTMLAAAEAVESLDVDADMARTWQVLAKAALLGARGNSGVIVSQALRGLADVFAATSPCRGEAYRRGLAHAADLAYDAVGEPAEGTVLSVLRAASEGAEEEAAESGGDLPAVARAGAARARDALARTPEQLDILAKNGVVDAGAAGLCVILDTFAAVVAGERPEVGHIRLPERRSPAPAGHDGGEEPEGPGYEVMYLLDAVDDAIPPLREALLGLGDCVVVVGGGGLWNVHVHADDVGAAIETGIDAGRPHRIRVTYLHAALGDRFGRGQRRRGRGVVAVAAGAGVASLFESAGAVVVPREPGLSPTLGHLLDAIRRAGDEVVLLPDARETFAVAETAADGARDEDIRTYVIPARSTVQGLAALAVHDACRRFEDDVIAMTAAAGATRFGEVTVATRAAVTSAGICEPGDVLGLIEGDVSVIGSSIEETGAAVVDRMLAGGGELVTVVTGGDAEPDLAERILEHLHDTRPDVDAVVYEGGQAKFPLLIGVE